MPMKDYRRYLATIGRRGGKTRTPAKTAASQLNGRRGGRPPTKSKAERLARIRARIDAGKALTPNEAALHYATLLRSAQKALAWALKKWVDTPNPSVERDWWDAVVARLECGVE